MGSMTQQLSRPPSARRGRSLTSSSAPAGRPPRQLTVAGMLAALQSGGLGILAVMVLVLVGWATAADSGASATAAVVAALQTWLVGHHATLIFPGGTFSLAPLGLTALPVALLHTASLRAGRAAGITGKRGVVSLTSAVTATYAVLAVAVALLARTDGVRPEPVTAFVGAAVVAVIASGSAAVRATGRVAVLWLRLPALVRLAVPATGAAAAALLVGGAVLTGAALASNRAGAESLVAALGAGPGGVVLLLLGSLALVPNAVVYGLAFAAGPGFAVGTGTSVTMAGAQLGAVPAVPLLAALPQDGGGGLAWSALAVPVVAGVLAALLVRRCEGHRRSRSAGRPAWRAAWSVSWVDDLRVSGLVGLCVAAVTGVLAALAQGSAGPGRMAEVGPTWWVVGPAVGLEVAVVTAAALCATARSRAVGRTA